MRKGKVRTSQRRNGGCEGGRPDVADVSEDEIVVSAPNKTPIAEWLSQLSKKRQEAREEALSEIVDTLTNYGERSFVENAYVTLLYNFRNCIRKGSVKEVQLATRGIGLVAMYIDCKDKALEIYGDSLFILSDCLKSLSKTKMSSIFMMFNCLAITTFFGAGISDETERTMQILWEFIKPDSVATNDTKTGVGNKYSAAIQAAAISAWSFLLTTMDGWRLNHKYWQGAISHFLDLLDKEDDESVHAAASEALILISESNCFEKFSTRDENLVKYLDLLKSLEDDKCLETSMTISQHELTLSWCQMIQFSFFKQFLGKGFAKHMTENALLHDLFECTKMKHSSKNLPYIPEREETTIQFFQQRLSMSSQTSAERKIRKRMVMSPNSSLNKGRTLLRNKQRMVSQEYDTSLDMTEY